MPTVAEVAKFKEVMRARGRVSDVLASMGTPNPRQAEFEALVDAQTHRRLFYGGARGPGKSWQMRRSMVSRRLRYPGSRGLLLRRTYEEVYGNHVLKLLQELPKGGYTYNASQHRFTFTNGSILELGYCKNDQDVLRYQGQEYDDIGIDELTQWREEWYDYLSASVRTTRTDGLVPMMIASGNPGGIGHVWVKRRWVDRDYLENETGTDYAMVSGKVYDNTTLMENDPEYLRMLQALPEDLRRAWLDGDWDVFAGQVFSELRREVHGFDGEPPDGWTFLCGDYGEVAPSAIYWVRVDREGDLWLFKELYESGLIYTELKKRLRDMSIDGQGKPLPVRYTVVSPDIFQKSKGTGVVGAEVLSGAQYEGFAWPVMPADNNRIEGWRCLKEWIHARKPDGTARLHVSTTACPNWWRTIPALVYDEHKPEDVDPDCEDHAGEAIRYGVMSRPRPAQSPQRKIQHLSVEWAEKQMV